MWKTLFDQARDFTNILTDPHNPDHARATQDIPLKEMSKLRRLWKSQTLGLSCLEHMFFPKASPTRRAALSSSSSVTGKTYPHTVKLLVSLSDNTYIKVFDRLARYAVDQASLPPSLDWTLLTELAHGPGSLTNDILRHIMFWLDGHHTLDDLSQDPSRSWSDALSVGPFAARVASKDGSLIHADQGPNEAAQFFVQNLFDNIRGADRLHPDWENKAAVELVRLPFPRTIHILTASGPSITDRVLSQRELSPQDVSTSVLSSSISAPGLAQGG